MKKEIEYSRIKRSREKALEEEERERRERMSGGYEKIKKL